MTTRVDLLLLGAAQVVTLDGGGAGPRRGPKEMNDLGVVEDGAVAVHRGRIVEVARTNEVLRRFRSRRRIFCRDLAVLPGFVDAHTHPVFARMREDEFAMRCRGATYEEILASGKGILASARAVQLATLDELRDGVRRRLDRMLLHGTTVAEAKSGYGLTPECEIKSLVALKRAARGHPIRVAPTLMAAHAVPAEYARRRAAYVRSVIQKTIPETVRRRLATFCDVFVEEGALTLPEARTVLKAAIAKGLVAKVHADEFRDGGGARLAAEVGAISAEHLGYTGRDAIQALAGAGVVAVLLPTTSLFLGISRRPDARAMIEAGVPVALATDFNPGSSPTENLSLSASLGCSMLRMTPEETITAITRNAACAAGVGHECGRLAAGYRANVVVLDAPTYTFVPYRMGTNLVRTVLVDGRVVVERGRIVEPE